MIPKSLLLKTSTGLRLVSLWPPGQASQSIGVGLDDDDGLGVGVGVGVGLPVGRGLDDDPLGLPEDWRLGLGDGDGLLEGRGLGDDDGLPSGLGLGDGLDEGVGVGPPDELDEGGGVGVGVGGGPPDELGGGVAATKKGLPFIVLSPSRLESWGTPTGRASATGPRRARSRRRTDLCIFGSKPKLFYPRTGPYQEARGRSLSRTGPCGGASLQAGRPAHRAPDLPNEDFIAAAGPIDTAGQEAAE